MIIKFKFGTFLIILFIKVKIQACLYIGKLHFNGSMICINVLLTMLSYLFTYTFFDIEVLYL